MANKPKIADARKEYVDAIKKLNEVYIKFGKNFFGKKIELDFEDRLYHQTETIEIDKGCDDVVTMDITGDSGIQFRFDLTTEKVKKLIEDLQNQLGELQKTNYGEESKYVVLDPDECYYTSGTLEEISDYLRGEEIGDISDFTICEMKASTLFEFDEDEGITFQS